MARRVAELAAEVAQLPVADRQRLLRRLSAPERRALIQTWYAWAHPGQIAPPGNWRVWLIRAGRGFGKTLAGAEWVSAMARAMPDARIALVGASIEDARRVMIEGQSGLIAIAHIGEEVDWRSSSGELRFASGARAQLYSAAAAEALRGPEHHFAWCDELAKWPRGDAAWDNLTLGLRLGDRPRVLVTTTPRSNALMRRVRALPDLVETHGRTRDNLHLPTSFVAAMDALYGGTWLGKQELEGEVIDAREGALWTPGLLDRCRYEGLLPELKRVVVAVDPPAGTEGDACGIVAAGVGEVEGRLIGLVLEDASVAGLSPEGWSRAVADCTARWQADRVIAEANIGGEMVRSVLRATDIGLPISLVHATRGKVIRAEPIAHRYELGEVRHAGRFPALEEQLCGLIAGGGYDGPGGSPDRADALVWALTELLMGRRGMASVRAI